MDQGSAPNGHGTSRLGFEEVPDSGQEEEGGDGELQRQRLALTIYLAYQAAGHRLTGPRLAELSGYSTKTAYRKIAEFKAQHGAIVNTSPTDDSKFPVDLFDHMPEGLQLTTSVEAAAWLAELVSVGIV